MRVDKIRTGWDTIDPIGAVRIGERADGRSAAADGDTEARCTGCPLLNRTRPLMLPNWLPKLAAGYRTEMPATSSASMMRASEVERVVACDIALEVKVCCNPARGPFREPRPGKNNRYTKDPEVASDWWSAP